MANDTRAHQFFRDHVLQSIRDWEASPSDEHRAMSVAVNLNHMADYYFQAFARENPGKVLNARDVATFRKALCARSPEFALLRDVADAHKHMKLDRGDRYLTSAGQSTIANLGWDEAKWGQGKWDSPAEVVVRYDDGSKHHFSAAVHSVLELWQSMLS